jgi:hypothetical protein
MPFKAQKMKEIKAIWPPIPQKMKLKWKRIKAINKSFCPRLYM